MKLVADSNGRIACKQLFPPGTPFSANRMPDGSIRLVELDEREVPLVEPVLSPEGYLMLPCAVDKKAIVRAIRADRDAQ
jgi:hypothetical protein